MASLRLSRCWPCKVRSSARIPKIPAALRKVQGLQERTGSESVVSLFNSRVYLDRTGVLVACDADRETRQREFAMKVLGIASGLFGLSILVLAGVSALAQDSTPAQAQTGGQAGPAGGQEGQRGGGRGGWGGGAMGTGRGTMGTVTEVAADHYTIKTDAGESYTIHIGANTRIMKMPAGGRGPGGGGAGRGEGSGGGGGYGGTPPETLKPTDIKVGDAVMAVGEVDAQARSVGAAMIMQIDPERARQMREMQANYGKTWLMGKVTAIDGVKVTLTGSVDNAAHTFVADENTTFRKRRDPITLADIQVGDNVRVDGAVKDGTFLATTVNAMGAPQGQTPTVPRIGPPPQ